MVMIAGLSLCQWSSLEWIESLDSCHSFLDERGCLWYWDWYGPRKLARMGRLYLSQCECNNQSGAVGYWSAKCGWFALGLEDEAYQSNGLLP